MKNIITLLLLSYSLFATLNAQTFGNYTIKNNTLHCDQTSIRFNYWANNWKTYSLRSFVLDKGYPIVEKGKSYTIKGTLKTLDGAYGKYEESITFESPNTCILSSTLTPDATKKFDAFSIALDYERSPYAKLFIDGKDLKITDAPRRVKQDNINGNTLEIQKPSGNIHITQLNPTYSIFVQDGKMFNPKSKFLNIRFSPTKVDNTYHWKLKIVFEKPNTTFVRLPYNAPIVAPYFPAHLKKIGNILFRFSDLGDKSFDIAPNKAAKISPKSFKRYAYLINTFDSNTQIEGEVAEAILTYKDGTTKIVPINAKDTGILSKGTDSSIWKAFDGKRDYAFFATCVDMGTQPPTQIELKNKTNSTWKIAAASYCQIFIPIECLLENIFITQNKDYRPYFPAKTTKRGSALDFSYMLDAPAGKYGFAKADGDEIVFENNPKPMRFYGTNLCFTGNYPTKENAVKLADELASIGYNILRIHHHEKHLMDMSSPDGLAFKADMLDRLDFFIAELKKRGIYITTDLYVSRTLAKDMYEFIPEDSRRKNVKAAFFISPKVKENLRKFSTNLLNHVNPYTNLAWKDEPAMVSISLVNENTILNMYWEKMVPDFYERVKKWCAENSIPCSEKNLQTCKVKYLSALYKDFFESEKKFLRSLGVRTMLTDQNYVHGPAVSLTRRPYDIIDTHSYYGHPSFPVKPWTLPSKLETKSSLGKDAGCITAGIDRFFDRPFSITEWNYVNNNDYCAEGALLMGAYASLNNWNMLCRFAHSHREVKYDDETRYIISYFDSISSPISTLTDRAAVLFYLRKDVKRSKVKIPYIIPENYIDNLDKGTTVGTLHLSKLTSRSILYGETGTMFVPNTESEIELPKNTPFAICVDKALEAKSTPEKPIIYSDSKNLPKLQELTKNRINVENSTTLSSTREMLLDQKNQTWLLRTPRSEAFIAPEGKKLKGNFAEIENTKSWSAISICSLEKKPLARSSRILILHLSNIKNTNMQFLDKEMTLLQSFGRSPLLAHRAESTIKLSRNLDKFKLYALASDGSRTKEIPISNADTSAEIKLSTFDEDNNVIFAYELVRE